jgi:hypothetical protein
MSLCILRHKEKPSREGRDGVDKRRRPNIHQDWQAELAPAKADKAAQCCNWHTLTEGALEESNGSFLAMPSAARSSVLRTSNRKRVYVQRGQ